MFTWLQKRENWMKPEWTLLKWTIRSRFPQVQSLSTTALADWLAADGQAPVLLDTRTEAEFAVSHLLNARRIDPNISVAELKGLALDAPIVTYCSVGYRSAAVCDRLRAAGFTQAVNLEGSIFQWANEGRSVYRNNQIVRQVHPYSPLWGLLLNQDLHAYTGD